ncbi:MAG: nucleotide pyrophosphohydrolase [Chloroflexi bacterium]|nr:MAG: nucleotide pyrophosphohydrolase [Chloroflexota bacterium]MBL1197072.1 nucleotide pyrophosphohydrolase [Chloroflexota bacterium]NOH14367.1 nucleotide pyrophosphohydrolase [Chloroflexota bacterium]
MNTSDLPAFQLQVADFVAEHQLSTDVSTRLLDLLSEIGELSKEALKGSDYGKRAFVQTENWPEELADVFFALICLANATGVDMQSSLEMALNKYGKRLKDRGDAGSGQ